MPVSRPLSGSRRLHPSIGGSSSALRRRGFRLRLAASHPFPSPIHCPAGHRVRRLVSVYVLPGKVALWGRQQSPPPPPRDAPPPAPKTIKLGQPKDQVVAIFGQPTKVAKLGAKEIDYYPDM